MAQQLDVFVCYRQVDGRSAASWLRRNLHGAWVRAPIDGADLQDVQLNVYFDQTTAAISDWKAAHLAALESAKAFVLVCTPGSFARLPNEDFVANEIQWWIEHRQHPPLLVDASGEGLRWTPPEVMRKWPDAQRIILLVDQWRTLSPSELQEIEGNTRQRLLEGIAQSGQAVIPEELTLQRRRNVRLSRLLKASVVLLLLVLGLAAAAAWAYLRSLESAKAARISADAARQQLADNFWKQGQGNRDEQGDRLRAGHRFAAAAAATPDATFRHHALLAAAEPVRRLRRTLILDGPPGRTPDGEVALTNYRLDVSGPPHIANVQLADNGDRLLVSNSHGRAQLRTLEHDSPVLVTFDFPGRASFQWLQSRQRVLAWGDDLTQLDRTRGCVRVWDVHGAVVHECLRHGNVMSGFLYDTNRHWGFTWGAEPGVRVWDLASGRVLGDLEHPQIHAAYLSPDGSRLVSTSRGKPRLWDMSRMQLIAELDTVMPVDGVQFSDDNRLIVSSLQASFFPRVEVWSATDGAIVGREKLQGFSDPQRKPLAVMWAPKTHRILCVYHDTIEVWNGDTAERMREWKMNGINSATFSPDGRTLAVARAGGVDLLVNFDVDFQELRGLSTLPLSGTAKKVTWSDDGNEILAVHDASFGEIVRWDTKSNTVIQAYPVGGRVTSEEPSAASVARKRLIVAWNYHGLVGWEDNRSLPLAGIVGPRSKRNADDDDWTIFVALDPRSPSLWTIDSRRAISTRDSRTLAVKTSVSLSPFGAGQSRIEGHRLLDPTSLVLWGTTDTTIIIGVWDLTSQRWIRRIEVPDLAIRPSYIDVSADRTRILFTVNGNQHEDSAVEVWDAIASTKLTTISRTGLTYGARFVGSTHRVIGWSGSLVKRGFTVWVHDAGARKDLLSLTHEKPVNGAMYSRDERHLLTWGDDGVRSWNVARTPSIAWFNPSSAGLSGGAYFTKLGTEVVSFGGDNYARIWPALEGKPATAFFHEGEPFGVKQAHLLADGSVLTLAHASARLWSRNGQLRHVFARRWKGEPNQPSIAGLLVDESEQLLITWELPHRVQFWNLLSGALIADVMLGPFLGAYGILGVLKPANGPIIVWNQLAMVGLSLDTDADLDVADPVQAWEARTGLTLDPFGVLRSLTRTEWNQRRR